MLHERPSPSASPPSTPLRAVHSPSSPRHRPRRTQSNNLRWLSPIAVWLPSLPFYSPKREGAKIAIKQPRYDSNPLQLERSHAALPVLGGFFDLTHHQPGDLFSLPGDSD
jgi:hypothetical protein